MWTDAIIDSMQSMTLGMEENVTWKWLTHLSEPKIVGGVVVLPIDAFGSGQRHSGASPYFRRVLWRGISSIRGGRRRRGGVIGPGER